MINLPDIQIHPVNSIITSNSCDINPANLRMFSSSICYCPIFNLGKYESTLRSTFGSAYYQKIDQLISEIRSQRITQIFYLPRGGNLQYDGFIFFDKICSCDNNAVPRSDLKNSRLFSLSDYGFYLFIFKLSIHFTRIREGVNRNVN